MLTKRVLNICGVRVRRRWKEQVGHIGSRVGAMYALRTSNADRQSGDNSDNRKARRERQVGLSSSRPIERDQFPFSPDPGFYAGPKIDFGLDIGRQIAEQPGIGRLRMHCSQYF